MTTYNTRILRLIINRAINDADTLNEDAKNNGDDWHHNKFTKVSHMLSQVLTELAEKQEYKR